MGDGDSSVNDENNEASGLVNAGNHQKQTHKEDARWYFVTEAVLIVGGIPSIIFFIAGVINGLLLMIEQKDYDICIAKKDLLNQDDDDNIKEQLLGSTIVAWILIVLYGQILFSCVHKVYPYSGVIYLVTMLGCLGFHITGIVWIAQNDCTSEHLYGLALFNAIWFFIYFAVMLTAVLILFFSALSGYNKSHRAVANNKKDNEQLVESQERMISDREPRPDHDSQTSGDHGNKNKPTIDPEKETAGKNEDGKDAKDNKEGDDDLDEEEIY
jgi:hypothetical protein